MSKKIITIALSLCLLFSVNAVAVNAVNGTESGAAQGGGERPGGGRGGMSSMGGMPSGDFAPPEGFTPPEGEFTPPQNSGEFTPSQGNEGTGTETTDQEAEKDVTEENKKTPENSEKSDQTQSENQQVGGQMPAGMGGFTGNMQNFRGQTQAEQQTGFLGFVKTYSTPITSVVLLGMAFIFVIFYRRKNY